MDHNEVVENIMISLIFKNRVFLAFYCVQNGVRVRVQKLLMKHYTTQYFFKLNELVLQP